MKCVISCEHASNRIPPRFVHVFQGAESILSSHRAYDPGAAALARKLANRLNGTLHLGAISRLLIDLNRSPTNRRSLFSSYSRMLPQSDREVLLQKYYFPFRNTVEKQVDEIVAQGEPVLHISVHSFSPLKNSRERKADVGLLYDPSRKSEKKICTFLGKFLHEEIISLRVRRNYPYRGKSDGFATFMRKRYAANNYAGVEIEMNQALLLSQRCREIKLVDTLVTGICEVGKNMFENEN